MVDGPEAYPWSSYHANALGHDDRLLTPHPQYLALGTTLQLRQQAYAALFSNVISDDRLAEIRAYIQHAPVVSTPLFQSSTGTHLAIFCVYLAKAYWPLIPNTSANGRMANLSCP